jgi:uncharacterized protein YndB with AHSA1/START domain
MPAKTNQTNGKSTAATGTVRLHRVIKAPPERIYKAVLDPAANCKFLPPHGFTCTVHKLEAKEGGSYKMSFTNFSTGKSHSFGGKWVELKPAQKIVATDAFDDPNLPGTMKTTWTFRDTGMGATEVNVVQEGIPAAIPAEMCYLGWQETLEQLIKLVEPTIPDQ